jgi:uncharacterized protein
MSVAGDDANAGGDLPAVIGDAERARLQTLLDAPPLRAKAMAIDELQGFCVAAAMGPDAVPPDDWISIVLGVPAESLGEVAPPGLVDLLDRFRVATASALDAGTLEIAPRTRRTGHRDYTGFCRGFLDGVDAAPSNWFDAADPDEVAELLFPIEVLGDALEPDERAAYRPADWRQLVLDCAAGLPATVARLAGYWRIVRTPAATIRRDRPKVGRNEPCPCGSGRKFKQCHGRE